MVVGSLGQILDMVLPKFRPNLIKFMARRMELQFLEIDIQLMF